MTGMTEESAAQGEHQSELTRSLASVRSRLAAAAEAAGRNIGDIELLPITKFFPATDVAILARLGVRAVGESRGQEASAKVAEVARLLAASPNGGSRTMRCKRGVDGEHDKRLAAADCCRPGPVCRRGAGRRD